MHTRTKHTLPPTQHPPGLVTVHGENGFHISLLCLGYYHRMHFIFLNCRKGAHVALNLLRKAIKRTILKQKVFFPAWAAEASPKTRPALRSCFVKTLFKI